MLSLVSPAFPLFILSLLFTLSKFRIGGAPYLLIVIDYYLILWLRLHPKW